MFSLPHTNSNDNKSQWITHILNALVLILLSTVPMTTDPSSTNFISTARNVSEYGKTNKNSKCNDNDNKAILVLNCASFFRDIGKFTQNIFISLIRIVLVNIKHSQGMSVARNVRHVTDQWPLHSYYCITFIYNATSAWKYFVCTFKQTEFRMFVPLNCVYMSVCECVSPIMVS